MLNENTELVMKHGQELGEILKKQHDSPSAQSMVALCAIFFFGGGGGGNQYKFEKLMRKLIVSEF